MATLPYKEYFGRDLYGELGPYDRHPDLIGPGILGANISSSGLLGDRTIGCPPGQSMNLAGVCVESTGTTSDGGCPHGFVSDGKGGCISANTCPDGGQPPCDDDNGGTKTCAERGLISDGMGGCKPKENGTTSSVGCPEGWARDKWGTCRPIHHIDDNGGADFTHVGGIDNAIDIATKCRWGRNPHTDQCNPNPYFSDWGSTDPDNPYGSPTALGGLPRDTGSGSSAYISGAGLDALDRGLYPSGFVPQSGILSGPEDMFSDGAYMGGSILDMANNGTVNYNRGSYVPPPDVTQPQEVYTPPTGTGPSASDLARTARANQQAEDARRASNFAPTPDTVPVVTPPVVNTITKDTDWVQDALDAHNALFGKKANPYALSTKSWGPGKSLIY